MFWANALKSCLSGTSEEFQKAEGNPPHANMYSFIAHQLIRVLHHDRFEQAAVGNELENRKCTPERKQGLTLDK